MDSSDCSLITGTNTNASALRLLYSSGVPRGWFGGFNPPLNSEDNGGILDGMSKKNRSLDFLLQFTVFSYGCNLLNKEYFNTNCLAVAYLVSEFKPTPTSRKFDKVKPDCKLSGKCLVFLFQHPN